MLGKYAPMMKCATRKGHLGQIYMVALAKLATQRRFRHFQAIIRLYSYIDT